jgi:large subunit ribosomal protein L6
MTAQAQTTEVVSQSRIGKKALVLPSGVELKIDGPKVSVKGPKGTLERVFSGDVTIAVEKQHVTVLPHAGMGSRGRQAQGLARALLGNMVEGASKGYATSLDLVGVGYRCEIKGRDLTLSLGLSHQVQFTLPASVTATVEIIDQGGIKRPRLHLASNDKEAIGQAAARIRSFRPPEPYKGKGVRYTGERIREKAGKAGGKK